MYIFEINNNENKRIGNTLYSSFVEARKIADNIAKCYLMEKPEELVMMKDYNGLYDLKIMYKDYKTYYKRVYIERVELK